MDVTEQKSRNVITFGKQLKRKLSSAGKQKTAPVHPFSVATERRVEDQRPLPTCLPPTVKLMSPSLYSPFSSRCSKPLFGSGLHSFSLDAKPNANTAGHSQEHEVSQQPGWEPPDGTRGAREWRGGRQRCLGEPGLLWRPCAHPQGGEHHLQPQPALPGLHGQRVQNGVDWTLTRGTATPAHRPKPEEEAERMLFTDQRSETPGAWTLKGPGFPCHVAD